MSQGRVGLRYGVSSALKFTELTVRGTEPERAGSRGRAHQRPARRLPVCSGPGLSPVTAAPARVLAAVCSGLACSWNSGFASRLGKKMAL